MYSICLVSYMAILCFC